MIMELERIQLESVLIKDIGWKEIGHDNIIEISENAINSYIRIVFSGEDKNWEVNPSYVIAKVRT